MPTLLLADDNVTVQRVIALTFAGEPVRVVSVSDGREAMDRVIEEPPDIVLAGTTLPHVSGYELARFVRTRPELTSVPVLLLSGAFEAVDAALVASSGAAGVVEKPVEPLALVGRVKELLGLQRDRPERDASAAAGPQTTAPLVVAPAVGESAPASDKKTSDYLDSLGAAFDSLDARLTAHPAEPRNPAPPLAQRRDRSDPRSPTPPLAPEFAQSGDPDFEVDESWFKPGAPSASSGATRELEQQLANEMGIHDLELPDAKPVGPPVTDDEFSIEPIPRALPIDYFLASGAAGSAEPGAASAPEERLTSARGRERLPSNPPAAAPPEITPAMLDRMSDTIAARLQDSLRVDAVAPEITGPIIEQIAEHVSTRLQHALRVEPKVPELTPAMLDQLAADVARRLQDTIRLEPRAPEITPPMLAQIADTVAEQLRSHVTDRLRESIRVEPAPPTITDSMLGAVAADVAGRLGDSIKVEPSPPVITDTMLQSMSADVAQRIGATIRVEPAPPRLTDDMLAYLAQVVADELRGQVIGRLQETIRVEPAAPVITEAMQAAIAVNVAQRLAGSIRVDPVAPHISGEMLDHIAVRVAERLDLSRIADHLRDPVAATLRATVRDVVLETSERLVRAEIERIKAKPESSQA